MQLYNCMLINKRHTFVPSVQCCGEHTEPFQGVFSEPFAGGPTQLQEWKYLNTERFKPLQGAVCVCGNVLAPVTDCWNVTL